MQENQEYIYCQPSDQKNETQELNKTQIDASNCTNTFQLTEKSSNKVSKDYSIQTNCQIVNIQPNDHNNHETELKPILLNNSKLDNSLLNPENQFNAFKSPQENDESCDIHNYQISDLNTHDKDSKIRKNKEKIKSIHRKSQKLLRECKINIPCEYEKISLDDIKKGSCLKRSQLKMKYEQSINNNCSDDKCDGQLRISKEFYNRVKLKPLITSTPMKKNYNSTTNVNFKDDNVLQDTPVLSDHDLIFYCDKKKTKIDKLIDRVISNKTKESEFSKKATEIGERTGKIASLSILKKDLSVEIQKKREELYNIKCTDYARMNPMEFQDEEELLALSSDEDFNPESITKSNSISDLEDESNESVEDDSKVTDFSCVSLFAAQKKNENPVYDDSVYLKEAVSNLKCQIDGMDGEFCLERENEKPFSQSLEDGSFKTKLLQINDSCNVILEDNSKFIPELCSGLFDLDPSQSDESVSSTFTKSHSESCVNYEKYRQFKENHIEDSNDSNILNKIESNRRKNDFMDNEAELSGSDHNDDMEDCEFGDDYYESDEITEDLPSQNKIKSQIDKVHVKIMKDVDDDKIDKIKEMLHINEDGTIGSKRVRKFKWKYSENENANFALAHKDGFDEPPPKDNVNSLEISDDTLSNSVWRKECLKRKRMMDKNMNSTQLDHKSLLGKGLSFIKNGKINRNTINIRNNISGDDSSKKYNKSSILSNILNHNELVESTKSASVSSLPKHYINQVSSNTSSSKSRKNFVFESIKKH